MISSDHPMPGKPPPPSRASETAERVTREMVQARTRSLAVKAGRSPLQISQSDYEQARRELTGESEMARQEARLDGAPERGAPAPRQSSATPPVERGPSAHKQEPEAQATQATRDKLAAPGPATALEKRPAFRPLTSFPLS